MPRAMSDKTALNHARKIERHQSSVRALVSELETRHPREAELYTALSSNQCCTWANAEDVVRNTLNDD